MASERKGKIIDGRQGGANIIFYIQQKTSKQKWYSSMEV